MKFGDAIHLGEKMLLEHNNDGCLKKWRLEKMEAFVLFYMKVTNGDFFRGYMKILEHWYNVFVISMIIITVIVAVMLVLTI